MQKTQILFPEPVLARLRRTARRTDRPVSELVRRATEEWLEKAAYLDDPAPTNPPESIFFHGGKVRVSAAEMKDAVYERD